MGLFPYALATSPRVPPPIAYTFDSVQAQDTADLPGSCPTFPIPLRNSLETYNTRDGKAYGGYTEFSILDIPSCGELNGPHMNFVASASEPWARAEVRQRPEVLAADSHEAGWAPTVPRWIAERLAGHPVRFLPSRSGWGLFKGDNRDE